MTHRSNIVVLAVVLMLSTLLLSGVFTVLTLDRNYRSELMVRYVLPVQHLQVNLDRAAKFGIPLDTSRGLSRDLHEAWKVLDQLVAPLDGHAEYHRRAALVLVDPRGRILRAAGPAINTRSGDFNEALMLPNSPGQPAASTRFVEGRNALYIPLRIHDGDGNWVASVIAVIDREPILDRLLVPRSKATQSIVLNSALALLFYVLVLAATFELYFNRQRKVLSPLMWISVVFGVLVMLGTAHTAARPYHPLTRAATAEKAEVAVALMHQDLGKTLGRGAALEFVDFSHYPWQGMLRHLSELDSLEVRDERGKPVVMVQRERIVHYINDRLRPLASDPGGLSASDPPAMGSARIRVADEVLATVGARPSPSYLRSKAMDLVADTLATTMVSILIFVELLLLLHYIGSCRSAPSTVSRAQHASALMRPAAFLFLFGIDFSMSFVPLYTERLYEPVLGLSRDVVVGLPISAEFLFVGIAMLAAGSWIDRSGWRSPFFTGIAMAGAGAMYSWLAPDLYQFIVARSVLGIGYGLTLMASQSYVIGRSDSRTTAAALAKLFAGVYGGSICGGVAGAILAEHFGFAPVFLAGGILVFAVLIYGSAMLSRDDGREVAEEPVPQPEDEGVAAGTPARLGRFLTNRTMLGLMLFSSLPASVAAVGFLNYFSPLYLNRLGASQSTIGQILMLYGVCLVFFGPWVSRSMDTIERKKQAVLAGCLLGGAAFLCFQLLDGVLAAAIAVVLLGMSHALVLSSQSAYALALKVSRDLGRGKAISVFRASGRLGQMLGPMAFGSVALAGSINQGIVYMGYVYLAMAALFFLCTWHDSKLLVEGE